MLPTIQYPIFTDIIPSTGEKITFRPFLVKEEKILLIAQQSGGIEDAVNAMVQILNNCILSKIDLSSLPVFDIEYLFLKIRAKSVNNIVELRYRDDDDDLVYDFTLNLDDIKLEVDKTVTGIIQLADTIGVVMKYPNFKTMLKFSDFDENDPEETLEVLSCCIDKIYSDDSVYNGSEHSTEELVEFLSSLSMKQMEKIYEFFQSIPKLTKTLTYKNSLGDSKTIVLEGIADFFP